MMKRMAMCVVLCWLALSQAACSPAELLQNVAKLGKVAQATQYLGTLVDIADAGQRAYFDRHPSLENEPRVRQAVGAARLGLKALDAALAAAKAADEGDVATARAQALAAYRALYDLLQELGIPQARPPAGGPETDAPLPEPFELPPADKIEALMAS